MKSLIIFSIFAVFLGLENAEARVYKNVRVGSYEAVIDLSEHTGRPFFEVMRDTIYPAINEQAANRGPGDHLDGIRDGEGVELVLTDDVTTYHVKYKADWEDKVERSGRSFGAIGPGRTKKYVADASYKHYLRTLESILEGDDEAVAAFFRAIVMVITDSDPSGVSRLDEDSKQVAADFVAIYVAEQYRRLTATEGRYLGRSHRWDDALVQVTLLSAFHSGQENMMLYYEGEFTGEVFHQDACLYGAFEEDGKREKTDKRDARLYDYWQFTVRSECPGRSGVNLTRKDFEKLGRALTRLLKKEEVLFKKLNLGKQYNSNFFKAVTEELLDGSFDHDAAEMTDMIIDALMTTRFRAVEFSEDLLN